jgi:hypothetical protein
MLGLRNSLGIAKKRTATSGGGSFANAKSLSFDGTNDYAEAADAAGVISGSTGTVSFWFKSSSLDGFFFEIKVDANNYLHAYYGSDVISIVRRAGGSNTSFTTFQDNSGNDGNWHHLAITWSEAEDELISYKDGSAEVTRNELSTWSGTPSIFTIGRYSHWAGGYLTGNIDEFSVFSSALSASDISDVYNSGAPTDLASTSGLVGYWRMEEGSGTSVADSSSNGNTATLVNGTAFDSDTP